MERRLFLTSRSSHPDAIKTLEVFLGGFRKQKVAYIPTANNGEIPFNSWRDNESFKAFSSLNLDLKIFQLEDELGNKDLINQISQCDVIFMAGGMPGYLMYWLYRYSLDEAIPKMLDDGMIYVGSSAGAMCASHSLDLCEIEERGASRFRGLGLIDFDILPHYNEDLYESVKNVYKGNELYLLKDGESVIVEGSTINVVGKPRILKPNL